MKLVPLWQGGQTTTEQSSDDQGTLMNLDPEAIIIQRNGEVVVTANGEGGSGADRYVIQYVNGKDAAGGSQIQADGVVDASGIIEVRLCWLLVLVIQFLLKILFIIISLTCLNCYLLTFKF